MIRKTALWTISLLAAVVLTGCVSAGAKPSGEAGVSIQVEHASVPGRNRSDRDEHFYVRMKFTNHTPYTHIIQEIEYQDGNVLVECFETSTSCYDHHTAWGKTKYRKVRKMRVYAANVEGEKSYFGFAHLHQNLDGSRVTSIGPNFNPSYWRFASDWMFHGKVVSHDRKNSTHWTLEYNPERDTLVVVLGE